jgi:hypothetical protein
MKQNLQKHFVGAPESSKGQRVKPERKMETTIAQLSSPIKQGPKRQTELKENLQKHLPISSPGWGLRSHFSVEVQKCH